MISLCPSRRLSPLRRSPAQAGIFPLPGGSLRVCWRRPQEPARCAISCIASTVSAKLSVEDSTSNKMSCSSLATGGRLSAHEPARESQRRLGPKKMKMKPSRMCKYYHSTLLVALLAAASLASQTSCQTSAANTDCARHQRPATQRQQRQLGGAQQQQQQPAAAAAGAKPARGAEVEQEEFSLSLGPQGGRQATNQSSANQTSSGQEPASGGQQQPEAASTTPAQPSDSIGSPVALQPPATTTSSSLARANLSASTSTTSTEAPASPPTNVQQQQQQQQQQQVATSRQLGADFGPGESYGRSQPVSSSPSSISIITPLLAPPNQAQPSSSEQSAMMKPILVLGNPISERDYAPAAPYEQQQQQPAAGAEQTAKSPKLADEAPTARPPSGRSDKGQESGVQSAEAGEPNQQAMNGPQLAYSNGHLNSMPNATAGQPRLLQSPSTGGGGSSALVAGNSPRRPSLPPPVNQANAASGFRSPMSPSGPLLASASQQQQQAQQLQAPANNNNNNLQLPNFYQTSPPYAGPGSGLFAAGTLQQQPQLQPVGAYNKPAYVLAQQAANNPLGNANQLLVVSAQPQVPTPAPGSGLGYSARRPLNITRVEHISAECSNDLIRAVIVFNGTFKGIIYSSGYVSDPSCLYVNGTGSTRYEFSIRLNQCGTLGREQLHQPTIPGEARRRDQVMWNTLSIQYNSIIEQEWDEHFRVSCEYGSDFWKTVSFSPFNVETNTGSPVVFTINPPQCQMDVLLGHGMGPKIAVDGPVTVGDPLTLLIHMKSEKAGYDILVKNCVAHNGSKQRMQLIDSNGCVVNERFISPFRGTYNDNDLRHVTLYAYLKAFRFTGSPVLYLECEIHMCQSACPPQMCYWRRLSKRSVDNSDYEYTSNTSAALGSDSQTQSQSQSAQPLISDSLSLFKALQVRQESESSRGQSSRSLRQVQAEDEEASLVCYRHAEVCIFLTTILALLALLVTIAITCCLRIRQLTRSQFAHKCLHRQQASSSASSSISSLSPSLPSPTLEQVDWLEQSQQLGRSQVARWNQRKQLLEGAPFGHLAAKVAPPFVVAR